MVYIDEEHWQMVCLDCGGRGYEEKLSCGCTGYKMRRPCMACKSKGVVNARMHVTQEKSHRKMWEDSIKNEH